MGNPTEKALSFDNKCLSAVVLPARRLVVEYEPCNETVGSARREVEKRVYDLFAEDRGKAILALGLIERSLRLSPSIEYWRDLSATFVHEVLVEPRTEDLRDRMRIDLRQEDAAAWAARVPAMVGAELVSPDFILGVWEILHETFQREVRRGTTPVEEILQSLSPGRGLLEHRVHFHLVENRQEEETPFAFLATYSARMDRESTLRHLPLSNALKEFGSDTGKMISLLSSVHKAASRSSLVKSLLDSGEIFHPLRFRPAEAFQFLQEVALYEECGILCRIPRWWNAQPRRISVSLAIGDTARGELNARALLSCRPILHIDGERISVEEVQQILASYEGLALIKGKWTVVDRESLQRNLDLFQEASQLSRKEGIAFTEAVRMLLGMERPTLGGKDHWSLDVVCGEWLREVLDKLRTPLGLRTVAPPDGLRATLRPYQQAGLNWLSFLHGLGFGACLADDMGLGKTVQVLSLLLSQKEKASEEYGPSLLVVPSSLIDNWRMEVERFAPGLRTVVAHPQFLDPGDYEALPGKVESCDIVITTYPMARRLGWLRGRVWYYLILDEAQAIKNPGAGQTRAVKEIPSVHRAVMTGTPIENRLGDLWSLFDFVNRGLLGSAHSFKTFAKSLNDRPEGYTRLRQVIQPYILRRLKTDKTVIADLPEKIEMKAWAPLSNKQVVLYQALVQELSGAIGRADGIKRKGIILAYLLKFKQVCNHPDQLAGSGAFSEEDSGKLGRLRELCEAVYEKRERMLVFTQFREMVDPLDDFLSVIFGRPGVQLHGGTSIRKRKEVVERFQNEEEYVPYFVLSVKAGGVGLNLTAANHVVHFDRWWNPAVERQAEDRAFRIGQRRTVVVHKFICKGTVEEKIDQMIEAKKELSEKVLSTQGESWITEMSDAQIQDMFRLTLKGGD